MQTDNNNTQVNEVLHTQGQWVAQNWVSDGEHEYPEEIRVSGWPHGKLVAKISKLVEENERLKADVKELAIYCVEADKADIGAIRLKSAKLLHKLSNAKNL